MNMLVDWLQVSSEDRSNYRGVEEDGPLSIKHAVLKDPTVIQPILSVRWKDGGPETFGELESHMLGGSSNDLLL